MVGPTIGGGGGAEREGKGGVVSSWRQEAPSEPPDKQCFQTREQGGSNSKVFFSRAALSLSGHEGVGVGYPETNIA